MTKNFHEPAPLLYTFDIPIFQKTYDLYKELADVLVKFPKVHKYTLGKKIDDTTIDLLEYLILAGSRSEHKLITLEKANTKLELLKVFLRLAKDIKSLDNKKYLQLQSSLQEIGRMLGGWIRHAKQTP